MSIQFCIFTCFSNISVLSDWKANTAYLVCSDGSCFFLLQNQAKHLEKNVSSGRTFTSWDLNRNVPDSSSTTDKPVASETFTMIFKAVKNETVG